MRIVLFEPEIPANTGNIVRTCAVTGAELHLIEPLGFSIDDKHLKRAGLDYWDQLDIFVYPDFFTFQSRYPKAGFLFFSTKGKEIYTKANYTKNDFLVFGKETAGLPDYITQGREDSIFRIPMVSDCRSMNLSNSVAVVLYEALRQGDFSGMS
ncbi:MAG: tRNA (uridine(34)/cytosine(34)/5-carboxymethylaminomethyluridine(34)-2'-O)-methyltransferase TrmL [Peptococcaceae bacterium]|nr:tRNA (uridine(34)/cytosine(34)/5-carboxymethylaminomethyluridine(34)-2'-O)-methyltransferase TrmL [Peptococcaceae bacterium]